MKFYFCEACGRRLTENEIEAGEAKDKKLKGVYCKACSIGVTTMDTLPLTDAKARELLAEDASRTADESAKGGSARRRTSGASVVPGIRKTSGKEIPAARRTSTSKAMPAAASGRSLNATALPLIGGISAVVVLLVGALLLFGGGSSEKPRKRGTKRSGDKTQKGGRGEASTGTKANSGASNDYRSGVAKTDASASSGVEAVSKTPKDTKESAPQQDPGAVPESPSANALAKLNETLKALPEQDAAGRIAAGEAFVKAHGGTPEATRVTGMIEGWRKALSDNQTREKAEAETAKKRAEELVRAKEAMRELEAQSLLAQLREKLAPSLKNSRLDDALRVLKETEDRRDLSAEAAAAVKREREDLDALMALRRDVFSGLQKRVGDSVELIQGRMKLEGKIKKGGKDGLTIKLKSGPEFEVRVEQLALEDVARYAPKPQGETRAESLRRLGLLWLALAKPDEARKSFEQARKAGLGDAVAPYLERVDRQAVGKKEEAAWRIWLEAEVLFRSEKWKQALEKYEELAEKHASSRVMVEKGNVLKARKLHIDSIIKPLKPGLYAVYYNGRECDPDKEVLRRVDSRIDFRYGAGSPDPRVSSDSHSTRWTGFIKIAEAGRYTFTFSSNDGHRLWINGKKLMDAWRSRPRAGKATLDLSPGLHQFRAEYFEWEGHASGSLAWSKEGGFTDQVVPANVFFHRPGKGDEPVRSVPSGPAAETPGTHERSIPTPATTETVVFDPGACVQFLAKRNRWTCYGVSPADPIIELIVVEGGFHGRTLDILNRSDKEKGFKIVASERWLQAQPSSGRLGPGGRKTIQVSVRATKLSVGKHEPTLDISDAKGKLSHRAKVHVEVLTRYRPQPPPRGTAVPMKSLSKERIRSHKSRRFQLGTNGRSRSDFGPRYDTARDGSDQIKADVPQETTVDISGQGYRGFIAGAHFKGGGPKETTILFELHVDGKSRMNSNPMRASAKDIRWLVVKDLEKARELKLVIRHTTSSAELEKLRLDAFWIKPTFFK